MPNLRQHTDPSGTFGTLGLGTVEAIRIKDTGEVEIPNLNNPTLAGKLDTANAFGVGQTWQAVTASRAIGVTYTNTTSKPILVSARSDTGAAESPCILTIDGVVVNQQFATAGGRNDFVQGVVPAGSTYSVSGGNVSVWVELR